MLSKAASSTIFWVFGMTRPEIELWSPRPLTNTQLIRPNGKIFFFILISLFQQLYFDLWARLNFNDLFIYFFIYLYLKNFFLIISNSNEEFIDP